MLLTKSSLSTHISNFKIVVASREKKKAEKKEKGMTVSFIESRVPRGKERRLSERVNAWTDCVHYSNRKVREFFTLKKERRAWSYLVMLGTKSWKRDNRTIERNVREKSVSYERFDKKIRKEDSRAKHRQRRTLVKRRRTIYFAQSSTISTWS